MANGQTLRTTISRLGVCFAALGCIGLIGIAGCASLNEARQNIARNQGQDIGPVRQYRTEQVAKDFDRNRDNAQFEAAASCWQRGDVEGSKTMLEHLLERNPNYPRARFVLADIYLFNGDSSRAIEELQKAVDSNPGDAVAHHALAQVLDASGQRNEALSYYKQAATLEPKNEIYALSYNTAMASTKPGAQLANAATSQTPQAALAPQANFAAAKVGGGVNITERPMPPTSGKNTSVATNLKPEQSPTASKDLNQQQQPVRFASMDDWVRPLDLGNNSADKEASEAPGKLPANGVQAQAMPTVASPIVAGPVAKRPAEPAAASASVAKSANGSAVAASYSSAPTKPTDPQNQNNPLQRSVEALAQGDTATAIELATAGLAQNPELPAPLYRVLGAAHYRRGEYQAAQIALAQALSLDKSDALAYFLMGSALSKLGQSETAARCFAEAARLDPRYGS